MTLLRKFLPTKWQDGLFAVGSIVFAVSLAPAVFGPSKPPLATSLPTALMLASYLAVYWSYKLWYTFVLGLATVGMWTALAIQVGP